MAEEAEIARVKRTLSVKIDLYDDRIGDAIDAAKIRLADDGNDTGNAKYPFLLSYMSCHFLYLSNFEPAKQVSSVSTGDGSFSYTPSPMPKDGDTIFLSLYKQLSGASPMRLVH